MTSPLPLLAFCMNNKRQEHSEGQHAPRPSLPLPCPSGALINHPVMWWIICDKATNTAPLSTLHLNFLHLYFSNPVVESPVFLLRWRMDRIKEKWRLARFRSHVSRTKKSKWWHLRVVGCETSSFVVSDDLNKNDWDSEHSSNNFTLLWFRTLSVDVTYSADFHFYHYHYYYYY